MRRMSYPIFLLDIKTLRGNEGQSNRRSKLAYLSQKRGLPAAASAWEAPAHAAAQQGASQPALGKPCCSPPVRCFALAPRCCIGFIRCRSGQHRIVLNGCNPRKVKKKKAGGASRPPPRPSPRRCRAAGAGKGKGCHRRLRPRANAHKTPAGAAPK